MKKTKRHLILLLKKKSGVELSHDEVKELMGLEPKKEEDKKAEDEKPVVPEAKADDVVPPKEDEEKPEEKAEVTDGAVTIESLSSKVDAMLQNMQMMMEALANMMDAPVSEEKPAEEEKAEVEIECDDEEDMTDEEMEKALADVVSEMEKLEG